MTSTARPASTPVSPWPFFGAIGVALSDNLLTLYLFYEIVSVCTYPLVAHHQDKESYEGARKYIVYLTATAKFFLLPALGLSTCWPAPWISRTTSAPASSPRTPPAGW
jgi:Formate hydrogenlyase subunit 3/Multisubunit Na+/H+ antiporter, MnhD subunit